jgi:hypothetical protein
LEARISSDNEASWGSWADITVDAFGKAILAHDGGNLIQVRVRKESENVFLGDCAQQYSKKSISDLNIGDKVVDTSWEWEHRTGPSDCFGGGEPYSGTGEIKPVRWIIVARDHYGTGSGLTLITEELIGKFTFNIHDSYSKNWGVSSLRTWLNSTGEYAGNGFYNAFSANFKNKKMTVTIPNLDWPEAIRDYTAYSTSDRVFVPSTVEMGCFPGDNCIGTAFPYFAGKSYTAHKAMLAGKSEPYWTRTPYGWFNYSMVYCNAPYDGAPNTYIFSYLARYAVRPVLNLSTNVLVSGIVNANGVYEIFYE